MIDNDLGQSTHDGWLTEQSVCKDNNCQIEFLRQVTRATLFLGLRIDTIRLELLIVTICSEIPHEALRASILPSTKFAPRPHHGVPHVVGERRCGG